MNTQNEIERAVMRGKRCGDEGITWAFKAMYEHAAKSPEGLQAALLGLMACASALAHENGLACDDFQDVRSVMAAYVAEAARAIQKATTAPPRFRGEMRGYAHAQLNYPEALHRQLAACPETVAPEDLQATIVTPCATMAAADEPETLAELAGVLPMSAAPTNLEPLAEPFVTTMARISAARADS